MSARPRAQLALQRRSASGDGETVSEYVVQPGFSASTGKQVDAAFQDGHRGRSNP